MKKFVLIVAVAAMAMLADSQLASAGRRGGRGGCGGGGGSCGGCGSSGGCSMGGCGSYGMGGCGAGGCGMGGFGGYAGCQTCGGGRVMGAGVGSVGAAPCMTCSGGVCTINPVGTAAVEANDNQATLIVNLPEDATLTVDNEATSSTSGKRVFVTPSLEDGKEYEYTLKAQVVRDGKIQTATAQVTVRPGKISHVELTIPATVAAQ